MIIIRTCPPGGDEWTEIRVEGEDEDIVARLLQSALDRIDWETEEAYGSA